MELRPNISLKDLGRPLRETGRILKRAEVTATIVAVIALFEAQITLAQEAPPFQWFNMYTQCGGELKGEDHPSNHVLLVGTLANGDFDGIDLGPLWGQCGNRGVAGDEYISPLPGDVREGQPVSIGTSDGSVYPYSRTYTQCGGPLGPMDFISSHTLLVDEFGNPDMGFTHGVRDLGPLPGQCGNL